MNTIQLSGRLTKDVELKFTSSGIAVTQFVLAVNSNIKDGKTSFPVIVAWNKNAENAAKYLKKGSKIIVEGYIDTRNYTNSNNQKVFVTEVIASRIEFLDTKSKDFKDKNEKQNENDLNSIFELPADAEYDSALDITDEDLPF